MQVIESKVDQEILKHLRHHKAPIGLVISSVAITFKTVEGADIPFVADRVYKMIDDGRLVSFGDIMDRRNGKVMAYDEFIKSSEYTLN